jgi:copper chaperone
MEKTLNIGGMHCASCEMLISDAVDEIAGAKVLSISHKKGEANVSYDSEATLAKIKGAIKKEGYSV